MEVHHVCTSILVNIALYTWCFPQSSCFCSSTELHTTYIVCLISPCFTKESTSITTDTTARPLSVLRLCIHLNLWPTSAYLHHPCCLCQYIQVPLLCCCFMGIIMVWSTILE